MKGRAHLCLKPFKDVKGNKIGFYRYTGNEGSLRQPLKKGTEEAGSSYVKTAVCCLWSLCLVVEFG